MESVTVTGDDGLDLAATGGSMTFFVPTDDAFKQLGNDVVEKALKNTPLLKTIVANHVVPGLFNSDSFKPELTYKLPSLFGTLAVHRTKENIIMVCLPFSMSPLLSQRQEKYFFHNL